MIKQVFSVNKLVRDNIPQIMRDKDCTVNEYSLEGEALITALKNKLLEEANEIVATKSIDELKEELADLMEVISAIAFVNKIDLEEIEKIRIAKNSERGSFFKGIYVSSIEIDKENPAIKYYKTQSTPNLE